MQITLVQPEIEAAIVNFITSQIAVRPEMRIDIVLAATRGEDGFTAIIDIVHKNSPRKDGKRVTSIPLVTEEEPTKEGTASTEAVVEKEESKPEPEPIDLSTVEVKEPAPTNPPAQPERPRSLFAGLQKTTNPS